MKRRSPTPSSRNSSRTSTPTPNSRARNKNSSLFVNIDSFLINISHHKFLFPIILILSIILSTIILNMAPSFCSSDGSYTSFKCKKCPDNSRCHKISFECQKGFFKINNNCVSKDQKDEFTESIQNLASNISKILDNNEKVTSLNKLCKALNETSYRIRTAIEFTDYRINNDEDIEKIFDKPSKIGHIFFTILSYIISLYGILILCYHFLRE